MSSEQPIPSIFPGRKGVGSLCIKCSFCTYSDETFTMAEGKIIGDRFVPTKILIPGTYICSNRKSEMNSKCVVGHLGCKEASQMNGLQEETKEWALQTAKHIANAEV